MPEAAHATHAPYYSNPREDLVHLIPEKVAMALDVGCGAGAFGAALKALRSAEVWGIELRADVAEKAATRLDKVIVGDAAEAMPKLPAGSFDLITFNDVLEHMIDAEEVLKASAALLAPGGVVLVSLPNLRFWTDFRHLALRGEFEYTQLGVLDRTHLRFFTKKSIPGFFARAGFRIVKMEGLNPTPSRVLRLINLLTLGRFRDCRYLQFGMIATPVDGA